MGSKKAATFAQMILNVFAERFRLRSTNVIDQLTWEADLKTILKTFRHQFVRDEWPKIMDEYAPDFQSFVNEKVLPAFQEASTPTPRSDPIS
jgi:hypothetical protein